MKFTAVGDLLMQRRLPADYEGFAQIRDYIARGDFRFCNLETTLNREGECFASQFSGGTWLRAEPEILTDALAYGFNALSFANNHVMDFSYNGLLKTLEYVRQSGVVNAGVGENLSRAAAPAYLDTPKGRIALISVVSTFHPSAMAGEQSRRFPGRPGVNGLRHERKYVLQPDQLQQLRALADATGANLNTEILRGEGYAAPLAEGCAEFGDLLFVEGEEPGIITKPNETDMQRIEKSIYEAQLQADYIIISLHAHENRDGDKELAAQFIPQFCHRCIDKGAHAIVGHGPHLLRGIEIYKNRPIFYSLGDFILEVENVPIAPEDFYAKFGLTSDATVHELFKTRSKNFTLGLMTKPVMMETVIPCWEMENGELTKLECMPVELGFSLPRSRSGLPAPAKDDSILERLRALSAPMGTKIEIQNGIGSVRL